MAEKRVMVNFGYIQGSNAVTVYVCLFGNKKAASKSIYTLFLCVKSVVCGRIGAKKFFACIGIRVCRFIMS